MEDVLGTGNSTVIDGQLVHGELLELHLGRMRDELVRSTSQLGYLAA